MSLDYFSGLNSVGSYFTSANDAILKEVKLLVKQEKYVLEAENNQLIKNNKELSSKIEELYDEFDITTRTYEETKEKYIDAARRIKSLEKKSKSVQKKKSSLLKDHYQERNTINDLRSQLISSQDSLSMMKIQSQEIDTGNIIKNKKIEILENNNAALKKKIKEMEKYNRSLQKESQALSKPLKNLNDIGIKSRKPVESGLTFAIVDETDSRVPLLKPENIVSPASSPIYIDIFDDKEKAKVFAVDQRKQFTGKFFPVQSKEENISKKKNIGDNFSISPIYADIPMMKRHKFTSTDTFTESHLESKNNKKEYTDSINKQRIFDEVDTRFVKRTPDHIHQNETIETSSSNFPSSSILLHSEFNEALLKKTSDEILKISEEQQQILNLLQKNSSTLEDLQIKNMKEIPNHSIPQKISSEVNTEIKKREMKNLSCQTDLIIKEEDFMKKEEKVLLIRDNTDLIKLINSQNDKIKDLSKRFLEIEHNNLDSQHIKHTDSKLFNNPPTLENANDPDFEKCENFTMKSETSLEDISNLTDFIHSSSDKATANVLEKNDGSKSLTSLKLSTSESQFFASSETIENAIENNADITKKNETLQNNSMLISLPLENVLEKVSAQIQLQPYLVNPIKFSSKIPKLITSKSVDLSENKATESRIKIFTNDLESSYETLYDPVLSARNETDNAIPM